jgi:DnaK suppressor protein
MLEELKETLKGEKESLERQLLIYKSEDPLLTSDREASYSLEDTISQTEGHDRITATRFELKGRLSDVTQALKKMENGTYGICENCGEKISEERLGVFPAARFCLVCSDKKGKF